MRNALDHAIFAACGDLQAIRHTIWLNGQGMIPGCGKVIGNAGKNARTCMRNRAGFAVHTGGRANNTATKGLANGLMTKTDPKQRDSTRCLFNKLQADTGLVRIARPGRNNDTLGI